MRTELEKLHRQRLVDFAFLYGSIASGRETAASDVDLIVIGRVTLTRLLPMMRRLQEETGREVNVSVYGLAEFAKEYAMREHFVRRVLDKPRVMLIGTDDDLGKVARKATP